jgi:hypothetical protein
MQILFLTSRASDYLQDSLLHGLKSLFGKDVIEYPPKPQLYDDFTGLGSLYGRGFTLYGTLTESVRHSRTEPLSDIQKYDLVIFGSIHRQFDLFWKMHKQLHLDKTALIDGEDVPFLFPLAGIYAKDARIRKVLPLLRKYKYFKREYQKVTLAGIFYKLPMKRYIWPFQMVKSDNIFPISFSIPKEKIVEHAPAKVKLFPSHIVDDEVKSKISGADSSYLFDKEKEYYRDLQAAKFGITTKRSGWDCMRHYEIAANGTIICFRNLNDKESTCAPHGLNESNSISYTNHEDLMQKINQVSEAEYLQMLKATKHWILENTTESRAKQLLSTLGY